MIGVFANDRLEFAQRLKAGVPRLRHFAPQNISAPFAIGPPPRRL
jgi:hypothetical protein